MEIEYFEIFERRKEARVREKYFKIAAGRRWIKKKLGPISACSFRTFGQGSTDIHSNGHFGTDGSVRKIHSGVE